MLSIKKKIFALTLATIIPTICSCNTGGTDNEQINTGDEFINTSNSPKYQDAYANILDEIYSEDNNPDAQYYLFDIDNDGLRELIVQEGRTLADSSCSVYTINDGGRYFCGKIDGSNSGVLSYSGGKLYYNRMLQGFQAVYEVTKVDNKINSDMISQYETSEYSAYGTELRGCPISERWLLSNDNNEVAWVSCVELGLVVLHSTPEYNEGENFITTISHGEEVVVLDYIKNDGEWWYYIEYQGSLGYICDSFLTFDKSDLEYLEKFDDDITIDNEGNVIAWVSVGELSSAFLMGSTNLDEYDVIDTIPHGEEVVVLDYFDENDGWYYIRYQNYTGYVAEDSLSFGNTNTNNSSKDSVLSEDDYYYASSYDFEYAYDEATMWDTNDGIRLDKYTSFDKGSMVELPSEIEGFPVTDIGWECFMNHDEIYAIIIPSSVKSINARGLWGMKNLKYVFVYSDNCRFSNGSEFFDTTQSPTIVCQRGSTLHSQLINSNIPYELLDEF